MSAGGNQREETRGFGGQHRKMQERDNMSVKESDLGDERLVLAVACMGLT